MPARHLCHAKLELSQFNELFASNPAKQGNLASFYRGDSGGGHAALLTPRHQAEGR